MLEVGASIAAEPQDERHALGVDTQLDARVPELVMAVIDERGAAQTMLHLFACACRSEQERRLLLDAMPISRARVLVRRRHVEIDALRGEAFRQLPHPLEEALLHGGAWRRHGRGPRALRGVRVEVLDGERQRHHGLALYHAVN